MNAARATRIAGLLALAVAGLAAIHVARRFGVETLTAEDAGMEPTYRVGERVLVDRSPGVLSRGDVVMFEGAPGQGRIARLSAVAGDLVDRFAGRLRVNGRPIRPAAEGGDGVLPPLAEGEALLTLDRPDLPEDRAWLRVGEGRLRGRVVLAWPF